MTSKISAKAFNHYPQVSRNGHQEMSSKALQMSLNEPPKASQMRSKASQMNPKASQMRPKASRMSSKVS